MATMDSPSAERNKGPIWSVLSSYLLPKISESTSKQDDDQSSLQILEVAAGAGVHTLHFASSMLDAHKQPSQNAQQSPFQWYPTDPDNTSRSSIKERILAAPPSIQSCISMPIDLTLDKDGGKFHDETTREYAKLSQQKLDLILCINMIHISRWDATLGLMKLATSRLKRGGVLYCYGPYKVNGTATQSNLQFDMALKARDSSWGVRNLEDVKLEAEACGLRLDRTIEMPANNLSVIFVKK